MAKARTMIRYRTAKAARRHSAAKFTLPVAVLAGFAPLAYTTYRSYSEKGLDGASQALVAYTTGYSRWENTWKFDYLLKGMGPVVAGIMVHKLAGRLGINRALSRARVPLLRI